MSSNMTKWLPLRTKFLTPDKQRWRQEVRQCFIYEESTPMATFASSAFKWQTLWWQSIDLLPIDNTREASEEELPHVELHTITGIYVVHSTHIEDKIWQTKVDVLIDLGHTFKFYSQRPHATSGVSHWSNKKLLCHSKQHECNGLSRSVFRCTLAPKLTAHAC